jgi:hypothetical protein
MPEGEGRGSTRSTRTVFQFNCLISFVCFPPTVLYRSTCKQGGSMFERRYQGVSPQKLGQPYHTQGTVVQLNIRGSADCSFAVGGICIRRVTISNTCFKQIVNLYCQLIQESYWFFTINTFSSDCIMQMKQKNSFFFNPLKALHLYQERAAVAKAVKALALG